METRPRTANQSGRACLNFCAGRPRDSGRHRPDTKHTLTNDWNLILELVQQAEITWMDDHRFVDTRGEISLSIFSCCLVEVMSGDGFLITPDHPVHSTVCTA